METSQTNTTKRPRKRGLWALLAVAVLLAAGFCAARSYAHPGFGFGPGGFGGGDPEQHKAFMQKHLDRMLDQVNATDSQRTAIRAIFARVVEEMRPIHQQQQTLHHDIATALAADAVDPAAIESLRKQIAPLVDRASQVLTRAILDAGQVLSPDQRKSLMKHIQERHGRMHRFQ
jgi:periplasmic protein CpxP/Spy